VFQRRASFASFGKRASFASLGKRASFGKEGLTPDSVVLWKAKKARSQTDMGILVHHQGRTSFRKLTKLCYASRVRYVVFNKTAIRDYARVASPLARSRAYTAYLTSSKLCFRRKDVLCKKTWLYNVFASFKCGSADVVCVYNVFASFKCGSADVVCVCGAETGCVHIRRMSPSSSMMSTTIK